LRGRETREKGEEPTMSVLEAAWGEGERELV
jgi:hypothetical protein